MTPAEAAEVRTNVWPPAQRTDAAGVGGLCACQWGPSGRCASGEHHLCRTPPWPIPYGYLTDRHGLVLAELWLAGRACRWVCPCTCHTRPQSTQLSLLEVT